MDKFITYLREHDIPYEEHVDLKKRTWIHRGGTAKLWVTPSSCEQLQELCTELYVNEIDFKIIGHTSNTYFTNNYNPNIIVSTAKLTMFQIKDNCIACECGVSVKTLSRFAVEQGYTGFEGLIDLPGTIASAIYGNCSCYNCSAAALLNHVEYIDNTGQVIELTPIDMQYSERSSILKRRELQGVILRVFLNIQQKSDTQALKELAHKNHILRKEHQEKPTQNLGSVFPGYVMHAFYKNLSLPTKLALKVFHLTKRIINALTPTNQPTNQPLADKDIICLLNGLWEIRRYISSKDFNRFIWKDAGADDAFVRYRSFIARTAKSDDIEIEIYNEAP